MIIKKNKKHALFPQGIKKYPEYTTWLECIFWNRCAYCLQHYGALTVDHFLPQKAYKHLTNDPDNLLPACPQCQSHKGNYHPLLKNGRKGVKGTNLINISVEDFQKKFKITTSGDLLPLGKNQQRQLDIIILFGLNLRGELITLRSRFLRTPILLEKSKKVLAKLKRSKSKNLVEIKHAQEIVNRLEEDMNNMILLQIIFDKV